MSAGRRTARPARALAVMLGGFVLIASFEAAAAATLTRSWRNVGYALFVADDVGGTVFREANNVSTPVTQDLREGGGANLVPPGLGVSAALGAFQESGYLPSAAPIGSAFDGVVVTAASAYVDGGQAGTTHQVYINGASRMFTDFTLDAPMRWQWAADEVVGVSSGDGLAEYVFGLYDNDSANLDAVFERTLTGNFAVADSAAGVLPAGNWGLVISIITRIDLPFVAGDGDHLLYLENGRFTLTPVPVPGAFVLLAPVVSALLGAGQVRRRSRRRALRGVSLARETSAG